LERIRVHGLTSTQGKREAGRGNDLSEAILRERKLKNKKIRLAAINNIKEITKKNGLKKR